MIIHSSYRFQQKSRPQSPEQWLREPTRSPVLRNGVCLADLAMRWGPSLKLCPCDCRRKGKTTSELHIILGREEKSHFGSFAINWSLSFSFPPGVTDDYKFDHTSTGLLLNYNSARRMGVLPPPPPRQFENMNHWKEFTSFIEACQHFSIKLHQSVFLNL